MLSPMARYIFITGGVVSSLGKGLASAALGALLQARGYKVRLRKLDPYLNVDPGTMSPYQHGEVFVTDDGAETDLDLGHYERFTGRPASPPGQHHHRPHLPGDHRQGAARRLSRRHHPGDPARHQRDQGFRARGQRRLRFRPGRDRRHGRRHRGPAVLRGDPPARQRAAAQRHAIYIHLTLLPFIPSAGELKTKPTQHSVKELRSIGIQPDILLCRTDRPIPREERRKLGLFCNVRETAVIEARDVDNIYAVPEAYHAAGLDTEVLAAFGIEPGAARSGALGAHQRAHPQPGRRRDDRDRRQVHRPEGRLQIADRGALARRHRQQGQGQARLDRERGVRARGPGAVPRARQRHSGAGRLRPARRRGKDPRRAVRARAPRAVFRHLLRHADGGGRGGAQPVRHRRGELDRVRADARAGGRPDDRMAQGQRAGKARRRAAISAAPCGSAPIRRCSSAAAGSPTSTARPRSPSATATATRSTPTTRAGWSSAACASAACRPTACCRRSSNTTTIPWFIGVQFHPELKSRPFEPHPLFASFIEAAVEQSRLV